MLKGYRKYYYSNEKMQLQEVQSLPLKVILVAVFAVVMSVCGILLIDRLFHDPLGLDNDQVSALTEENRILREQLLGLKPRMEELDKAVRTLNTQGNVLRLMVDLPRMDNEVASAGTGGAMNEADLTNVSKGSADILHTALTSLQRLTSEIKVQQQSYKEVIDRYEYNKDYFASLPALKPMEGYYSPSGFGLRMHPVLGIFKTHEGLDIVNDVGTPVYAAGNGVIAMAGQSGGGYGIVVAINHGYGYQTLYAHLSKVVVREGQHVHRGDLIAKSGRTGLVSGPHLHYEVRYKGVCRNPVDFFFDDVDAKGYRNSFVSH